MLLRSFLKKINENIEGILPETKVFGLAQSIVRSAGEGTETLPGVVAKDGEIEYVGIDDVNAIRIYHKINTLTSSRIATKEGYGDELNDVVNLYQMSMIVWIDHKRTKLHPEDLFLFLQANIPDGIKASPYKRVLISVTSVNFNSRAVFTAEYAGVDFRLPENKSLFQLNYNIESTFAKNCFVKCPTDC